MRDVDGDGHAEVKKVFLSGLTSPFGMALVGNELFFGNADALVKVPYVEGETENHATLVKVTDLHTLPNPSCAAGSRSGTNLC